MIDELKTDYKDDVLATSQQGKRTFNIVGKNGEILFEDVHIEDTSRYLQVGDEYGGDVINETNGYVNQMDDKLDELIEFMDNGIKAEDVIYNDSNVKLALDTLGNNLGSKSSASEVTGDDAFSKIATLNTNINNIGNTAVLWSGNAYAVGTKLTLSASFKNYDLLMILGGYGDVGERAPHTFVYAQDGSIVNSGSVFTVDVSNTKSPAKYLQIKINSNTEFEIQASTSSMAATNTIREIRGIKL